MSSAALGAPCATGPRGLGRLAYPCLSFCFYYCMGALIAIVSLFLSDEGISTIDLGLVLSASALFSIVLQPILGLAADLVGGPRRPALVCVTLILASCVMLFAGRGVPVLFVANGLCQGLIVATVPLLDNLILLSGLSYGRVRACGSAGYAVGVQLAGLLYALASPLAAFGSFLVVCAACLVSLLLTAEPAAAAGDRHPKADAPGHEAPLGPRLLRLLRDRPYLVLLFVSFVLLGLHYANIAYMPLLVRDDGGDASLMGTILLVQTLFEVVVVFFSDRILARLGERRLLVLTAAMMAARMLWYATAPSNAVLLGAFFFQGLTVGLFYVAQVHIVASSVPSGLANTALAVVSVVGKGLGALVMQELGGALLAFGGYLVMYGALGVIGLVGAGAALAYRRTASVEVS